MKIVLAVVLGALVLTISSLAFTSQTAEGSPHLLPPDRARLVAEKEQARTAAGVRDLTQSGPFMGPNEPYRTFTRQVVSSRAEFEANWNAWTATELAAVERESGPAAAGLLRVQLQQELEQIRSLPDAVIQQVQGIEIGRHSYQVSVFTDNLVGATDPINTFFYRKGTSWDVQYDMKNWTTRRLWVDASGSYQRVYIWDSMHTGGWDGWQGVQYQLKPNGAPEYQSPRYHIRLFGSLVQDSHVPGAGYWTVGDAHWDNQGHTCSTWEDAEAIVKDSFRDGAGNPMWFVGQIYVSWFNNSGYYQCGTNDGYASFIELVN